MTSSQTGVEQITEIDVKLLPDDERHYGFIDLGSPAGESVRTEIIRGSAKLPLRHLPILDPLNLLNEEQKSAFDEILRFHPRICVSRIRNAMVSGTGLIMTEDGYLLPESNIRDPHAIQKANKTVSLKTARASRPVKQVEKSCLLFPGVWPVHYGHWLYDNFARLGIIQDKFGDLNVFDILLGYGNRGKKWWRPGTSQNRYMELAGLNTNSPHVITDHQWALVEDAIVVSPINNFRPPTQKIFAQPDMFRYLRGLSAKSSSTGRGKRIYCSRMDTQNRMMTNEEKLADVLRQELGFEIICLGECSADEQIAIFRDAEIAVGPLGNAFMNMSFMSRQSKILLLSPVETWHFLPYYQSFSTAADIQISILACPTKEKRRGRQLNDLRWEAPIDEILAILKKQMPVP